MVRDYIYRTKLITLKMQVNTTKLNTTLFPKVSYVLVVGGKINGKNKSKMKQVSECKKIKYLHNSNSFTFLQSQIIGGCSVITKCTCK